MQGLPHEQYNTWRYEELGGRQPRRGLQEPREARTAGVMNRMAQATEAGPVAPETQLAMLGEANKARGYPSAADGRASHASKAQVGVCGALLHAKQSCADHYLTYLLHHEF